MIRGSKAAVTWPKSPASRAVETAWKLGWFQMLKNSERNWSLTLSPMGNDLYRAQFQAFSAGPWIRPVPQFPKVPNAGAAKAALLNHCETFFGPDTLPTQSGRAANPLVPVAIPGVKANPLSITVIPENVQPPSAFPAKSLRCLKTGRL